MDQNDKDRCTTLVYGFYHIILYIILVKFEELLKQDVSTASQTDIYLMVTKFKYTALYMMWRRGWKNKAKLL